MAYHDEYIELISANLDGALSPAEQEKLEAHLASCPECKALYEELTAVHAALSDLPPVEVPADLTDRIMAAVAAEQILPFAPAEKKKAPVRWQRWLASAAVLAVVIAGTWSIKPWEHTANDLKPQSAELQQPVEAEISEAAPATPEASMSVAAPEAAAFTADSSDLPAAAPETAPVPEPSPVYTGASEPSPKEKPAVSDVTAGGGSTDAETAVAPRMAPVNGAETDAGPFLRSAPIPAPENGGGDSEEPASVLFSTLPTETPAETEAPAVQSFMVTSMLIPNETAEPTELTARAALDRLLEEYPMPEEASLLDTGDVLGWETPLSPVDGGSAPSVQQVSTRLEYVGLSSNGKYHEFWLSSFLLDDPDEGLAHSSTVNFFAVPLDGGEILVQCSEEPKDIEAYQAEIEAYLRALSE